MLVREAIDLANERRPNTLGLSNAQYYAWLSEAEAEITEHMRRHEATEHQSDVIYTEGSEDTELLLPLQWEMIYVLKLCAEIEQELGEIDVYNNDAAQYNQRLAEWKAWYTRNNKRVSDHRKGWKII